MNSKKVFKKRILIRPYKKRLNVLLFVWSFLFILLPSICFAQIQLHALDVGYADAFLLELPDNQNVLVDVGSNSSSMKLIQYLKNNGVKKIDHVFITHPHENHYGGILNLLNSFKVGNLYLNRDESADKDYNYAVNIARNAVASTIVLKEGYELRLTNDVNVHVLSPKRLNGSPNDNSLVLKFEYFKRTLLLMGDVGGRVVKRILKKYKLENVDVVTIPHHGDQLHKDFINTFVDKIFLVSTGENIYGLPHEESLSQLKGDLYRTDRHGDIKVIINQDAIVVKAANE